MIATALRQNFGYANAMGMIKDLDETLKKNAIFASLDAQTPTSLGIEYIDSEGKSRNGHSIVADGYGYDARGLITCILISVGMAVATHGAISLKTLARVIASIMLIHSCSIYSRTRRAN